MLFFSQDWLRLHVGKSQELPRCFQFFASIQTSSIRWPPHPDFEYSVATGSWRESALLKIRSASLSVEVLSTCDDSPEHEQIPKMSIERACSQYNLPPNTTVTLVGDAPWDVQVATNLHLHFVGVGGQRLLEWGAKHVIEDFTDVDRFLELAAQV